ncbi:MAG: oligoendopeptidase F, partial [Clostridia bacterium]
MAYKQRNEIPEKYTWKLEDMYATLEDWEKAFTELSAHASDCTKYKGKLNNDVTLLEMLKEQDEYSQQVEKLYCYAFMAYCEDRKDTDKQSRYGKVMGLLNNISALSSFIEPELSELSDEVISRLIVDKRFTEYDEKLKALLRGKAHVLSAEEEKILANSGSITQSFSEIFNRLDGGEISFGKITIDGKEEELTHGLYSMALSNSDQKVRREAFNAYYKGYIDKINTISGIYEGSVKSDWFYAQSKKFGSSMELALFSEDVDRKVYDKLIEGIHKSLAPLHEYMQFRKDIMGLSELNMYDLYCPIVEDTDKACSYEEATEIVKSGLAPLGKDYLEVVNKAFNERWID